MADKAPEPRLPNPTSVGDFYLKAILDELRGLRADKARAPATPEGTVELTEPAKPKRTRKAK